MDPLEEFRLSRYLMQLDELVGRLERAVGRLEPRMAPGEPTSEEAQAPVLSPEEKRALEILEQNAEQAEWDAQKLADKAANGELTEDDVTSYMSRWMGQRRRYGP